MLSKDEILNLMNRGLNIFKYYISFDFRIGRNFFNPLYEDTKASCNIYFDSRNKCYNMKDFGNDEYSGDSFCFVGKLKGLDCTNSNDFKEILKTISSDLQLDFSNISERTAQKPLKQKQPKSIPHSENIPQNKSYNILQKEFSEIEMNNYWGQSFINTNVLKRYKVVSLKEFQGTNNEGKLFRFLSSEKEPIFGYLRKGFIKISRPFSEIRFLYGGVMDDSYCFGLEQLPAKGDTLFITGGERDVMSLAVHGFYAICFNSETSNIPSGIIRKLRYRFKHIVLLYDVDKTGLEISEKHRKLLTEFDVKRLLLPLSGIKEEKDITDYFRLGNTREDFVEIFLHFLDNLYNEIMSILKPCEIDFNNPPINAETIISINDVSLGSEGNLLCVTGGEGTGKSNYVGSFIAGTFRKENELIDTIGTTIQTNLKKKAVLLYDTEQSEMQLFKNVSNVLRRSNQMSMPDYFKAYCLTGMSRKERLQAIVQSMDKFYYEFGGIQMVVIDGVADLILCANDEGESVGLVDELFRLAGIYKTCIVCVLHHVPNGLKLRGHLGSELQRKAAAILSIELETDTQISVIKALKVRDGSPLDVPLIQFGWNKELGMHTYLGEKSKEEKDKRKEDELFKVFQSIFAKKNHLTYLDLCGEIQIFLDVRERTAKSYIKFMRDKEIILKDPDNHNLFIFNNAVI